MTHLALTSGDAAARCPLRAGIADIVIPLDARIAVG